MQPMMQFIKEVYLTGFAIIFNRARVREVGYKAGGAICVVATVESLILMGVLFCLEMFFKKKLIFSKPIVIGALVAIFLVNEYILFIRGRGIKFAREFESFARTKRVVLEVRCAMTAVAAIVFFIFATLAYRRFFGIK